MIRERIKIELKNNCSFTIVDDVIFEYSLLIDIHFDYISLLRFGT